jgi:hypothetical protein
MYRAWHYASGARHFELFGFGAPASISHAVINGVGFAETLPDDEIVPAAASADGH